jgi:hypothetical protein
MGFLNKKFSQIIDKKDIVISKNKLLNSAWLKTNTGDNKVIYSFLNNKELIVSTDGDGKRGMWEFIVDNDTLIIEKETIEVFNCQIIYDEFLILNKDNTTSIEIFGNLSKFKNNQGSEVQSKFNILFQRLSISDEIQSIEKLYILKIYEILMLLESTSSKSRLKRLFNELVFDEASRIKFETTFFKIANKSIIQSLNQSKFTRAELLDTVESLIKHRVVSP